MSEAKSTTKDLTVGSPFKLIVTFAIPMILGNLFQQLYNFFDTMIVGHFLGVEALAGVGATGSINFLIIGFCMGICSGFSIPVSQQFGARNYKMLRKYVANSVYLFIIMSAVITVTVSLLCKNILNIMQTPADIYDYSYTYILTIFIGIPVTFAYNMLAGFIRSVGDSKTPLIFLVIATVINVILDIIFIAVLHLGVFGAALATILSQLISAIMCFCVVISRMPVLHVKGDEWEIDRNCMSTLLRMSIPMGLQYSITAIGSVIVQSSVNMLGSVCVAAITAANKVNMLFMCILDALGASMATYGGQNLGAGKIDRIRSGVKSASVMGIVYSVFAFAVSCIVKEPLLNLFVDNPSPEMLEYASMHITATIACFSFLVFIDVLRFLIQGVGYSALATFAGFFEMVARALAGFFIIPRIGFLGACIASPLAWVFADLFLFPAYFYVMKKLENDFKVSNNLYL